MWFWIYMLIMNLLIPAMMIFLGHRFIRRPPREINSTYGYRTGRSMKNHDTWEFAHHYFGRLWYVWGLVMLPATVVAMMFLMGKDKDTVGWVGGGICFVQILILLLTIIPTEKALRNTFDNHGIRK